jgi:hypothetical protein
MPGVRLVHPNRAYWGKRLVIEVQKRKPEPEFCHECSEIHPFKTYHLKLESDGSVIVSTVIRDNLLKAIPPLAGMLEMNEVTNPPTQELFTPIDYSRSNVFFRQSRERG